MQPIQQTVVGPLQPLLIPITSLVDLTTATALRLDVERPDGTTTSWVPTLVPLPPNVAVTASQAYASYAFVTGDLSAGGVAWRGNWRVTPVFTFPSGPVTYPPVVVPVVSEFGTK